MFFFGTQPKNTHIEPTWPICGYWLSHEHCSIIDFWWPFLTTTFGTFSLHGLNFFGKIVHPRPNKINTSLITFQTNWKHLFINMYMHLFRSETVWTVPAYPILPFWMHFWYNQKVIVGKQCCWLSCDHCSNIGFWRPSKIHCSLPSSSQNSSFLPKYSPKTPKKWTRA